MQSHIVQLSDMARKNTRVILGLMSGTSLDGLDMALCAITGSGRDTQITVLEFASIAYSEAFKTEIRAVFAKESISFLQLTLLHATVARQHAALINRQLSEWKYPSNQVDLIASHGQTVFHAPKCWHGLPAQPNATFQIGDGDHIAALTGIITVSDFRQKHVALGGEGAPLVLYGDYFLYSKPEENRVLLNIGGISNFTFLPASSNPKTVLATDCGPGNTLIDWAARTYFNVPMDTDGLLAEAGMVQDLLLQKLLTHPFLQQATPKSTGPEMFSATWLSEILAGLPKGMHNPHDIIATLTTFTARCIADALAPLPLGGSKTVMYLSGGGAHNPLIIKNLAQFLPNIEIRQFSELGLSGDAKEAVLFAVLANETVAGQPYAIAELGGAPLVGMGKISFPN